MINDYINQQKFIFTKIRQEDFERFSYNFKIRTKYTVPTILKALEVLMKQQSPFASDILSILQDEVGNAQSHYDLLNKSFDSIGKSSGEITCATSDYILMKEDILSSSNQVKILSNFVAHEMTANSLLNEIKNKFFNNKCADLSYFDAHVVEEQHGKIAQQILIDEDEFERFLKLQLNFLRDLSIIPIEKAIEHSINKYLDNCCGLTESIDANDRSYEIATSYSESDVKAAKDNIINNIEKFKYDYDIDATNQQIIEVLCSNY